MVNNIKFSIDDIRLINYFERTTKASVKDCIVDDKKEKITFIVKEGDAGIAIGKGGANIKRLREKINKKIEVLEFSEDPIKFVSNVFRPITINSSYVAEKSDGTKTLYIDVGRGNLGMKKNKIRTVRNLVKKYFKIEEVSFK